jgi:putative transferase (TIGR04331 family)
VNAGGPRPLLVATSLDATWAPIDPGAPLVLLAPWCRRCGGPAPQGAWSMVPDPWTTPEARRAGEERRRTLERRLFAVLGRALAELHRERWEERTTRLLLGPWAFSYLSAQIDRWERLALAARSHSGLVAWGIDPGLDSVPADTLDAVERLKGDVANLECMTPMMRALGIDVRPLPAARPPLPSDTPPLPAGEPSIAIAAVTRPPRSFARRAAEAVMRMALATRGGPVVALRGAHFAPAVQIAMMRASRLAIAPLPDSGAVPRAAVDSAQRARLAPLDFGTTGLERHLSSAIVHDLPVCFLEGYAGLRAAAAQIGPFPKAVLSANAWHYDEPFKLWAASAAGERTVLLGVQHGGNYGIDACSPSEEHETAVTDVFYTWGWTGETTRAKTVPMPAPKLVGREAWTPDPARRGILLVTTSTPRYSLQLDRGPEGFERTLDRQRRFVLALSDARFAELRVRPHREDSGWGIAERLTAARPGVTIETWQVPFDASLAAARLFVCDHLSTTFAEALAARRPTVLFWDPADTPIRDAARDVFEGLRAAGILFDDPESAARAVDAAGDDVAAWWGEPARVHAVAAFAGRFARTSAGASREWVAELLRFARGSLTR